MCPGLHTYIHIELNEMLLETDEETNELCLQWVQCIPGTTTLDCSDGYRKPVRHNMRGMVLLYALGRGMIVAQHPIPL